MTIRYECAECGASLNIKDELAGTQGRCPKCKKEFTVPAAEPAGSSGKSARGANAAAGPSSGFDDEDITAILSGEDSPSPAAAVTSRRKADAADDAYGIAGSVSDDGNDGPNESDAEPEVEDKQRSAKKKARNREDEERIADAASVARALMGRAGKSENDSAEDQSVKKRFGRVFGGGPDRGEDDEAFSTGEVVKYFAVRFAAPVAGIIVACSLLYWLGYTMMGGSDIPPLGRVTGVVTLDGKPLANAVVTFIPLSEEANKEVKGSGSTAYTDASGRYDLQYSPEAFGAIVGKHLVTITALDPETGMELLPPAYNSTSTLTEAVKPGSNAVDFPLQSQPAAK